MLKSRFILFLVVFIGLQQMASGQAGSTKSPYSRYAYGLLADPSLSGGHAMGGLGYGIRKSTQINPLNPASYSAVDSLTFLFDMGVDLQFASMREGNNKISEKNGNLRNINLLFPLGKGLAFSAGILPISHVGYEYADFQGDLGNVYYTGEGGFQQVYGGLAYKLGSFSVGANIGYIFGDIEHFTSVYPGNSTTGALVDSVTIRSHDLLYQLGIQQELQIAKGKKLILGASFSPKLKMSAKGFESTWIDSEQINHKESVKNAFEMAQSLGIGASIVSGEQWTAGIDILWQDWKNTKINAVSDSLNTRMKYAVGGEYIPNSRSRNYLDRIHYRAGVNYSNSYISTNSGVKYNELGLSVGFGLPINKSLVHLSFDYIKVNPSVKDALSENYFKINLSYTFSEIWFKKWRLY